MSRFSHRQPAWTFGTVVLLSTLLLSPVAASVVLRALVQTMAPGEYGGPRTASLPTDPAQRPRAADSERLPDEPRRVEEEDADTIASDGERYQPRPDTEEWAAIPHPAGPVTAITLLLPTRIMLTVPDDPQLSLLPAPDEYVLPVACLPPVPPRAPPIPV